MSKSGAYTCRNQGFCGNGLKSRIDSLVLSSDEVQSSFIGALIYCRHVGAMYLSELPLNLFARFIVCVKLLPNLGG